jgi:hypothetical protein
MTKKTYIALVPLNVHHVLIVPGASVDLTDDEAKPVLAVGAVTTQAAMDAAKIERKAQAKAAADAMKASVQAPDPVELVKTVAAPDKTVAAK